MGDFMKDITNYVIPAGNTESAKVKNHAASNSVQLDMTDFLTLMVTELTNQSIDETADTSDMLNQLVQMQMVQAMVNMTDASVMSYAASLVGKHVTVGQTDANGKLVEEIYGEVTGTGTMNGQQVVFVKDKYYFMNEIMAVGKLPKPAEGEKPGDGDGSTGGSGETGGADGTGGTEGTGGTGGTESGGSENEDGTADPGAAEQ